MKDKMVLWLVVWLVVMLIAFVLVVTAQAAPLEQATETPTPTTTAIPYTVQNIHRSAQDMGIWRVVWLALIIGLGAALFTKGRK